MGSGSCPEAVLDLVADKWAMSKNPQPRLRNLIPISETSQSPLPPATGGGRRPASIHGVPPPTASSTLLRRLAASPPALPAAGADAAGSPGRRRRAAPPAAGTPPPARPLLPEVRSRCHPARCYRRSAAAAIALQESPPPSCCLAACRAMNTGRTESTRGNERIESNRFFWISLGA